MSAVIALRLTIAAVLVAGCTGTPRPPESPAPSVLATSRMPTSGPIPPGRYVVERGPWATVRYALTMPAGWTAQNSGQTVGKHPDDSDRELGFSVSIVDNLFADPCGRDTTAAISQSSESLVLGLKNLPGTVVSSSEPISIGGRSGLKVGLAVAPDVDVDACDPPIGLQIWLDRSGNKYFVLGPESTTSVYALDAPREVAGSDDELFVLVGGHRHTSSPEDIAELLAIINSIEFEP